jgi:hypothetical protein
MSTSARIFETSRSRSTSYVSSYSERRRGSN